MRGHCARGLNPTTSVLTLAYDAARANPKRVVFAEGEEEVVLRAAIQFRDGGYGVPVLVGRDWTRERLVEMGVHRSRQLRDPQQRQFAARPRDGRFAVRTVAAARLFEAAMSNAWSTATATPLPRLMLKMGLADAMITGVTRTYAQSLREVKRVIDPAEGKTPLGVHIFVGQHQTIFLADTTVNERPTSEQLADIAERTAMVARGDGARAARGVPVLFDLWQSRRQLA